LRFWLYRSHGNCQAIEGCPQPNEFAVAIISKAKLKIFISLLLLIAHRGSCRSYHVSKKPIKRESLPKK
jgi:hypothetical protein